MEQYDYESEDILRRASDAGTSSATVQEEEAGNTSASQSSIKEENDHHSYPQLTINTRRRLIRKPLPKPPGQKETKKEDQNKISAPTSSISSSKPDSIHQATHHDSHQVRSAGLTHSAIFAGNNLQKQHTLTLEEARSRAREFVAKEKAILEWWPDVNHTIKAEKVQGAASDRNEGQYTLNARCRLHLERIVEFSIFTNSDLSKAESAGIARCIIDAIVLCLSTLTKPEALAALQQTSSVMWRVDALVRSNEQLSGARGGLSALLGILGVRWSKLASWRGKETGELPIDGLGGSRALMPALDRRTASSSSSITLGTEQRRRKRDVAMQLLNNAFWTAGINVEGEEVLAKEHEEKINQNHEEKKRLAGTAPSLLSKPMAPTVALTGELASLDAEVQASQKDKAKEEEKSEKLSMPTPAAERPSMLTDRLAMQLRNSAKLQAEGSADHAAKAGTLPARSPMSRTVSHASILDKNNQPANNTDTAKVKIAVSKVCVRFEEEWNRATAKQMRTRRKSETLTLKDVRRRFENVSSMSGRSDKTIGHLLSEQQQSAQKDAIVIDWLPDKFDGEPLHLNPLSSDVEGRDADDANDGIKIIGGSFVVYGVEEKIRIVIHNTIDIALYAAIAMVLETAFLMDFDLDPKGDIEAEHSAEAQTEVRFAEEQPQNEEDQESHLEKDGVNPKTETPQQSEIDKNQGQWRKSIWSMLHMGGSSAVVPANQSPDAKAKRSSVVFPRIKTADAKLQSNPEKDAVAGQYSRLGRILSSFTGHSEKKTPSGSSNSARIRSFSDAKQSNLAQLLEDESTIEATEANSDQQTSLLDGKPPKYISAYREEEPMEEDEQHVNEDLIEELVSRQTLSVLILEGLDISLPFARQVSTNANSKGTSTTAPANPATETKKGSTLSVHPTTQSRISSFSRATDSTAQSNQDTSLSGRAQRVENRAEQQFNFEKQRREVLFYQRGGNCRDASLGQAIEEMTAKAIVLHNEWLQTEKSSKREKDKQSQATSPTFKIAQYLHGRDKITVSASIVKTASSTKMSSNVTEAPTPNAADAKEVANALKTDKDLAQTALRLAEHIQSAAQHQPNSTAIDNGSSLKAPHKATIEMWHADMRTGRQTAVKSMSDATYLASYGTFLNDLMTSHFFTQESPLLLAPGGDDAELLDASDDPKRDLVRLFKIDNVVLKFHVQTIPIHHLLIDGPVVCLENLNDVEGEDKAAKKETARDTLTKSLVKETRLEVQAFFASVKEEISRMEQIFVARELDINGNTVKPSAPSSSGHGSVRSVFTLETATEEQQSDRNSIAESTTSSYAGAASGPLELLGKVMSSMRKAEFRLYESLKEADVSALNDIRRQFQDRAKSCKNRLVAWSKKHLNKNELEHLGTLKFAEPYYFEKGNHALPGSRFVLRQEEPLSIIAYSLSSRDFNEEIHATKSSQKKHSDVLNWRSSVAVGEGREDASSLLSSSMASSSAASVTSSKATDELDPDQDDDFHVPEPLQVNMKRKRRTKDTGILSIRIRSSVYSNAQKDAEQDIVLEGEKEIDESMLGANDNTSTPTASRISSAAYTPSSTHFDTVTSNNETFHAHVSTISPRGGLGDLFTPREGERFGDLAPPSDDGHEAASLLSSSVSSTSSGTVNRNDVRETPKLQSEARTDSSYDGDRRADLDKLSKEIEDVGTSTKGSVKKAQLEQTPRIAPPFNKSPASPHIKHTIISGDLKISCVSWFAEDFNKLRKTWKIEEDFIASLSRSKSWSNVGGKSKSGFYLTGDGKWIAKQLLNVWTVDEKEAFLEFAPAYLRYMMNSAVNDCPTLLVKIAGVYSLKIKDTKTGEVKLKLSVQVLENVFAGDGGRSIRFDLKGIRDRRAQQKVQNSESATSALQQQEGKPHVPSKQVDEEGTSNASVWWDGEWIDTMLPRAFVPEHQKTQFQRALRNDLAFLTASNVMDYSLLVGVNEPMSKSLECPFFRVRIVDFLGAWTLVKQLESSGKKAIKSQTPTVIPPQDYASRFSQSIEGYFIGCPDTTNI